MFSLWKSQGVGIDEVMEVNYRLLKEVKASKAQLAMESLKKIKTTGIVAAITYLTILGLMLAYAIAHYSPASNYFIVSMGIIFAINVKAFYDYVKHLVWAHQINYDGPIMEVQEKLSRLRLSIVKHCRAMSLQLPFWTTFYLNGTWFPQNAGWPYLVFQTLFTGLFCYATYWALKNLRMENSDKKWFKWLVAGSGGEATARAMRLMKDIEEFKKEA